jgi:TetR/AcrR family transcriptional regulator, lmrAB and yxaGH operons repressor
MPAPIVPKEDVIARITKAFQAQGYHGASLADLSKETGLVKASLYHYFPDGKRGMAEAALEEFATTMSDHVITPLTTDAAPRKRLLAMIDGFDIVYNKGQDLCLFALLSVGDTRELFKASIAPKVVMVSEALTKTLRDAGLSKNQAAARAEEILVQIEGGLILARVLSETAVFERTLKRLRESVSKFDG